ncbi:MAG: 2Fe-2S iron-sulfur cluster-binding protein [Thermoplasmatota archaeon]
MAPATFRFDGREIPMEATDTFGSALHRAGVKAVSRSLKYHRPRGLFCCTGSCASCFVDVDGVPNVPACMATAREGADVQSQNRMLSARHDLLGVVDKVYRHGFDPHAAFTRPRLVNDAFLKGVRFMSGLGRAPGEKATGRAPRRHEKKVDELVVGSGKLGLQSAAAAARAGRSVLLVEEMEALGGSARWDASETETVRLASHPGAEAWTGALCFGLYAQGKGHVAGVRRGDDLWEVEATRITVAAGRHDAWPLFENNDLPGILSLRGARRLLGEHQVLPGRHIVVDGPELPADFLAELQTQGADVVATGKVTAARGRLSITRACVDGTWRPCDALIAHAPGTPRVELLQQAGCELAFDADGRLAPIVAADGTTSRAHIRALFSGPDRFAAGPTPRTREAA